MEIGNWAHPLMTDYCNLFLDTLKSVVAKPAMLHEPNFSGNEWVYVKECIDTGWVSTAGKFVERFEQDLATFTHAKHTIATSNGTAALHACLELAGVRRDDEVILPTLTFVATANAVAYIGAVPHFADSEEKTLGLDANKLKLHLEAVAEINDNTCINTNTGRPIRAVICVHTYGHPVDIDPLIEVCRAWKLILIEDAAESLGSTYKGQHTGNFGRLAAFSFNGNKTITTGGGGAILTNDSDLARQAKHLTTTAKTQHSWEFNHDRIGYNYRMPNINAALGVAQLEQLPEFLNNKRRLANRYRSAFDGVKGMQSFQEPEFAHSNYWLNVILLEPDNENQLEPILKITNDAGYMTRPTWTLMHRLPMYETCPKMDLGCAQSIQQRLINLPSSSQLAVQ